MASANCPAGDPAASPKHSNGHASPLDLIRRFHKLQTKRVEGYSQFEEAFNTFLGGAPVYDFNAYKQRVAEITVAFRQISEEIIHIKNSLKDTHNKGEISAIIEKIQDLEEVKLKSTADLQIARKNASDEPESDAIQQEISHLHQKLDDLAQEITDSLEDLKFESEDLYAQEIEDETSR
ncbi:required for excision 1-B domain-containing protein-like [Physella acuta]|uniref:required for excision 1-B domain-containing protein-like n=1 Tax=Physella acuta TaxID=109671 RepID=UPI0027DB74B2|nr:required for excision 1-B domain-containing protein-like [Physella acuta]XP_059173523.1 required for excision 1-B domain-containing protein-like [Physella acuta]